MGANLTEPLADVVHSAAHSDTVPLRCNGRGVPAPNITLTYINNGEVRVFRQAVGELINFPFIITDPTMVFTCTASNYIVNADGEPELFSQSATITINEV